MDFGQFLAQAPKEPLLDFSGSHTPTVAAPAPSQGFGAFLGSVGNSIKSVAGSFAGGVVKPLEQAGKTIASFPVEAAKGIYHEGASVADLATGNMKAAENQQKQLSSEQGKSYLTKEYGSKNGDLSGVGHAIGFGLTAATLGAGTLEKSAAETAAKEAATGLVSKATTAVTDNAKSLVGAGKTVAGTSNPGLAIAGKAVRNSLLVQPTAQFAGKTVNDFAQGNVKQAAIDTALWGIPGIAKLGTGVLGAAAEKVGTAIFGKSAILNEIFSPGDVQKYLAGGGNESVLKQIEQFTLNQSAVKGNPEAAAGWLKNYIDTHIPGIGTGTEGINDLVNNFKPYAHELEHLQTLQAADKDITLASGKEISTKALTVSHNYMDSVPAVQDAITHAVSSPDWHDASFRIGVARGVLAKLGIADDTLNKNIAEAIALGGDNADEINGQLDQLLKDSQKNIVKDLGNGFIYTSAPKGAAHLPSAEEVAGNSLKEGKASSAAGTVLTKAGLSPRSTDPAAFNASLEDNLEKRFAENGVKADAPTVLNILEDQATKVRGAGDIRTLSAHDVEGALQHNAPGVSAKAVVKSVRQAYGDVPARIVGAGPKFVNKAMNPLLAKYLKIQGLGKFELNPFFRYGKVPIKGGIVAVAHGADPMQTLIGGSAETRQLLKNDVSGGWFAGGSTGGSGTVSDELGDSTSAGTMVNKTIQRQISGLVDSVARTNGTTTKAILDEKGDLYNELQDSVGLIKGYGKGGYLNSPLAKSLNLAIFPSRFDTKVIQSAAKIMGKMSVSQQIGTVVAVNNLHGFLSSPEGQKWQQQNLDFIGLLKYFTPIDTLQGVSNFFTRGFHVQDLGQIGGLPFGVISAMVTHQGVQTGALGSSQFFANGKPIPSAIPTTDKARFQTAMTDLISSMFSYPGETVGLQSKTKFVQGAIPAVKPASNSVQYKFANGSLEGAPNAPQPQSPSAAISPKAVSTQKAVAPTPITPITQKPVTRASSSFVKPPSGKKTVPVSQQLPGSSNFAL